jgi:putative MATE family efflux protein
LLHKGGLSVQDKQRRYNLTEGSILSKLMLVALPIMGTQLMQMTYNLTDMYWLGHLSSDAVAASGSAGMYLWLSQAFMLIGRMGAEIGVAQSIGRGDREKARDYAQNALFLSLTLGLLYGLVLIVLNRPLIGFFGIQEAHVAADAAAYLRWVGLGVPMVFVTAAIGGSFNASGNSRVPFLINSVGLVINMIFDPLMIFTWNMGIVGAALATVLGQTVVFLLSILALLRHKDRPFEHITLLTRPNRAVVRQIFVWSVPIGFESMLFTFLSMLISRFVAGWGASAIAVQRVGSQIESLSWLLGAGLGSAFTAYTGQNFGAGRYSRIRQGYNMALRVALSWGVFVTALLFFAGGTLYGVFVREEHIIRMGGQYMRILALCQIPAALEGISSGAFKGMGRTLPPTLTSVGWNAFRVPLAYLLSQTALGLDGIWIGVTIGAALRGMSIFIWYRISSPKLLREDPEAASPTQ